MGRFFRLGKGNVNQHIALEREIPLPAPILLLSSLKRFPDC